MPPRVRSTPPPRGPKPGAYHPTSDNATYRDLLLFEERLKTNAASLQSRKSRYQLFLVQLLLVIVFLLWEVLLPSNSSILVIPYRWSLKRLFPDIDESTLTLHPYFTSGLLFVSVTTLVLFFASGMYSEKIAYANRYVPHANRSLRSFNMYLNVRKPPLRSKFYFNPLGLFFPRQPPTTAVSYSHPSTPTRNESASTVLIPPSSTSDGANLDPISKTSSSRARRRSSSTSRPIPPIPPTTNPRGELIFSSRVDRGFREGYERYRSAFEKRRSERERDASIWGRLGLWGSSGKVAVAVQGKLGSARVKGSGTPSTPSRGGTPTPSGTPSRGATPTRERSGSPMRDGTVDDPGSMAGLVMRDRQRRGSPMRIMRQASVSSSRDGSPIPPP